MLFCFCLFDAMIILLSFLEPVLVFYTHKLLGGVQKNAFYWWHWQSVLKIFKKLQETELRNCWGWTRPLEVSNMVKATQGYRFWVSVLWNRCRHFGSSGNFSSSFPCCLLFAPALQWAVQDKIPLWGYYKENQKTRLISIFIFF